MRERKRKEQNEILDRDNYIRAFDIDQLPRRKIDDTGNMMTTALNWRQIKEKTRKGRKDKRE